MKYENTIRYSLFSMIFGSVGLGIAVILLFNSLNKKEVDENEQFTSVNVEQLLKSSVSNIKQQGKLVVTSMDVQTTTSSQSNNSIFAEGDITTISWGKVQYIMDLRKLDPNWISVKDNEVVVVLPKDFVVAEIIATSEKHIDNSNWWTKEEDRRSLKEHNLRVNKAQMITQANGLLDVVRPTAAQELKNIFNIPIRSINQDISLRVTFG